MASTPNETPSTLWQQCLQYLIDHLEDIPVEAFALLPPAIRRTLAVHLPVADILHLEQTRFASGLDTPGVWNEVRARRHLLSRYQKLVEKFESELEAKEFVMMVVVYEALHKQEKPHFSPVFTSSVSIVSSNIESNYAVPSRFYTMYAKSFNSAWYC